MKLEFAKAGTFSHWLQGYFAGCVHPDERTEQVALAAWNAARLSILEDQERHGELPGSARVGRLPIYRYDRYHLGKLMAEGMTITTARNEAEAHRLAEGLLDNNGDTFVLRADEESNERVPNHSIRPGHDAQEQRAVEPVAGRSTDGQPTSAPVVLGQADRLKIALRVIFARTVARNDPLSIEIMGIAQDALDLPDYTHVGLDAFVRNCAEGYYSASCAEDARAALGSAPKMARPVVTDEMVTRFLSWKLPQDFAPDAGIKFFPPLPPNSWPVGTNLLTADQARAMLEHVLSPRKTLILGNCDACQGYGWLPDQMASPCPKCDGTGSMMDSAPKVPCPVYYSVREGDDWKLWWPNATPRPPTPEDAPFRKSGRYGDWGGVHFLAIRFGDGNSTRVWTADKGWLNAESEERKQ